MPPLAGYDLATANLAHHPVPAAMAVRRVFVPWFFEALACFVACRDTRMMRLAKKPIPVPDALDGVVLYDGVCVPCSADFRFVVRRDPAARFRFTPVQGEYGSLLAQQVGIDPDVPQPTAVVMTGQVCGGTDAALIILRQLPGWAFWARLLLAVPRPLRVWTYDRVARHRYRLSGRTESCLVPGPELARHCLPPAAPHG